MSIVPKAELIHAVEAYFQEVDRFDTDAIMAYFVDDCVMEIVNYAVRHEGMDTIRGVYDARAGRVQSSWHGDFQHTVDEDEGRVATRLIVRRTNADGSTEEMENLTLFVLEKLKIRHLSIWMSGENTLTN